MAIRKALVACVLAPLMAGQLQEVTAVPMSTSQS